MRDEREGIDLTEGREYGLVGDNVVDAVGARRRDGVDRADRRGQDDFFNDMT